MAHSRNYLTVPFTPTTCLLGLFLPSNNPVLRLTSIRVEFDTMSATSTTGSRRPSGPDVISQSTNQQPSSNNHQELQEPKDVQDVAQFVRSRSVFMVDVSFVTFTGTNTATTGTGSVPKHVGSNSESNRWDGNPNRWLGEEYQWSNGKCWHSTGLGSKINASFDFQHSSWFNQPF